MFSTKYVPTEQCDYPSQPRSNPDPEYYRRLGENMKAIGQQVPIIGYTDPVTFRFNITDGGSRREGAKLCGISELLVMDLGKKPTVQEMLMAQASIDIHKQHLPALDRARLYEAVIRERGCTAKELAKDLGVSDSLVGHYLLLLALSPDLQEQVNCGKLQMSKASVIARETSDPDRQRELAALAIDMPRDKLAAKVRQLRRNGQQTPEPRVSSLSCPLPSGTTVIVKGREISLLDAIQALTDLLKAMKKASEEGIDSSTFARVCKDRAKAAR